VTYVDYAVLATSVIVFGCWISVSAIYYSIISSFYNSCPDFNLACNFSNPECSCEKIFGLFYWYEVCDSTLYAVITALLLASYIYFRSAMSERF